MTAILDTHAFIWLMTDDHRLSKASKEFFLNRSNDVILSIASVWEMAIKASLKKLALPLSVKDYIATRTRVNGIGILNVSLDHVTAVESLPFFHKDPFDRLIIAQSILEQLPILTNDRGFHPYPVELIW